ncbi:MAG TPA: hypothetical protein VMJ90_05535 [Anaerolineales bacterium]|nr:hypothetical protein [Anaerolineales bacterium]
MDIKRRLPLVSLIVLSVFVCLGAFVVIWTLSVDAKTATEKVQSSLTLGLPSALVLIVLLWLGAGVDHLLVHIQNKSARL